jgi:hypothetical protein
VTIMRPVLSKSPLASYLICKLVDFPGSRGPGSFDAREKLGLSNVTANSHFSFNGFLKSIAAGFGPAGHFTGPYGCGAVDFP